MSSCGESKFMGEVSECEEMELMRGESVKIFLSHASYEMYHQVHGSFIN